ncbi:hypothetical protein NEHOM01_2130 [Nematocida homosporus]|uniref:uncharacterized protein n=1 Tax=Nematocida homosporus TaxID=1912981 RepID=UPI00221FA7A4|nr:uncharacterized protein NEHOM01_2130 [Nematocida homosporus]KAI5187376.1 hypothetical protein NEHOM01_2130 [Nematocida homosporus]
MVRPIQVGNNGEDSPGFRGIDGCELDDSQRKDIREIVVPAFERITVKEESGQFRFAEKVIKTYSEVWSRITVPDRLQYIYMGMYQGQRPENKEFLKELETLEASVRAETVEMQSNWEEVRRRLLEVFERHKKVKIIRNRIIPWNSGTAWDWVAKMCIRVQLGQHTWKELIQYLNGHPKFIGLVNDVKEGNIRELMDIASQVDEWDKESKKERQPMRTSKKTVRCYTCNKVGHLSKDC